MCGVKSFITKIATVLCITFAISLANAANTFPEEQVESTELPVETDPEPTEENTRFKLLGKKPKNLLLVPIPTSSPTFGTGLILGGAYFYPQTEEQKKPSPPRLPALLPGVPTTTAGLLESCSKTTGKKTAGDSPAWQATLT